MGAPTDCITVRVSLNVMTVTMNTVCNFIFSFPFASKLDNDETIGNSGKFATAIAAAADDDVNKGDIQIRYASYATDRLMARVVCSCSSHKSRSTFESG